MDPARTRHAEGEHGYSLALPRRRRRQAAAGERPARPARDAAPDPHSRPALPRHGGESRAERASGVERYGPRADRLHHRRAARAVEPWKVDAPLPCRRAHRDRHAHGVRGGSVRKTGSGRTSMKNIAVVITAITLPVVMAAQGVSSFPPAVQAVISVPESRVALQHVRVVDGTGKA